MKLMVYGTLKLGYGNNALLRGASFLGEAFTEKRYALFNCGFPKAVTFTKDEELFPMLPIMGEVFEINDKHLSACDSLEGHPVWYKRDTIRVLLPALQREEDVMIYEMNEWVNGRPLCNTIDYNNNKYYYWDR